MREYGFSLTRILPFKDRIGKMRVSENQCSRIFYAVTFYFNVFQYSTAVYVKIPDRHKGLFWTLRKVPS